MNKPVIAGGAAVVLLGLGAWWYLGREPVVEPEPEPEAAAPVAEAPAIKNPVATADDGTLPALDASDGPLADALGALIGSQAVQQVLIPKDLIRHIVVTIDNLPRKTYAQRLSPLKPAPGKFVVAGADAQMAISPGRTSQPWRTQYWRGPGSLMTRARPGSTAMSVVPSGPLTSN